MPIYDLSCICGHEEQDIIKKYDEDYLCVDCGGIMTTQVQCTHFKLEYNNKRDSCDWFGNTSQYWNDYKAAKARGEKVKPSGSD